jgi:hypothetical protein
VGRTHALRGASGTPRDRRSRATEGRDRLMDIMGSWFRRFAPASLLGRAVFCASVLFLGWATWHAGRELRHPFWDLSRGVERQFRRVTPAEYEALPKDIFATLEIREIFHVDGWSTDKPLISNWSQIARPYPPGELMLMVPFAAAYHWVKAFTFTRANWTLVLWFLFLAHLAFGALLYVKLATPPEQRTMGFFAVGLLYLEMVHWALEGFYDPAGVTPLVLSCLFLAQRRGLPALVWYCMAAFIHYRAFFLAPLPLYALWLILRERSWQSWKWPQYARSCWGAPWGLPPSGRSDGSSPRWISFRSPLVRT